MTFTNIASEADITDERVAYLAGLAQSLSTQSDFTIQNYSDQLISSPDVKKLFDNDDVRKAIGYDDDVIDQIKPVAFNVTPGMNQQTLALNFTQESSFVGGLFNRIKAFFIGLRRKVQRIFCEVIGTLNDDELDLKTIIKKVLLVLIPSLAATVGLIPIAVSIIVSLAAMMLKYGISKVCPV